MKLKNPRVLSFLIWCISKGVQALSRIQKLKHPDFNPSKPCIYAFWHGDLFLPILTVKKMINHPAAGFVSYSKDGEILSQWLSKMGYAVVRGSSSKKGISGMKKMLTLAKQGYSFGIAPDGPRGPQHHVSEGLLFLAVKTKLPIVPVGVYCNRAKVFQKSWDKFFLPKPFSKSSVYFAEPFYLDSMSQESIDLMKSCLFDAYEVAKNHALKKSTLKDSLIGPVL